MEIDFAPTEQLGRFVSLLKRIARCLEGRRESDLTVAERQVAELLVADGFLTRDAAGLLLAGGELRSGDDKRLGGKYSQSGLEYRHVPRRRWAARQSDDMPEGVWQR